ncbi:hypothetical protein F4678DRAFT_415016 [Xylaria arbuscula]|nr:hypothetical protein F4678DRAFT_415016 [Xylaria arbuscula]
MTCSSDAVFIFASLHPAVAVVVGQVPLALAVQSWQLMRMMTSVTYTEQLIVLSSRQFSPRVSSIAAEGNSGEKVDAIYPLRGRASSFAIPRTTSISSSPTTYRNER